MWVGLDVGSGIGSVMGWDFGLDSKPGSGLDLGSDYGLVSGLVSGPVLGSSEDFILVLGPDFSGSASVSGPSAVSNAGSALGDVGDGLATGIVNDGLAVGGVSDGLAAEDNDDGSISGSSSISGTKSVSVARVAYVFGHAEVVGSASGPARDAICFASVFSLYCYVYVVGLGVCYAGGAPWSLCFHSCWFWLGEISNLAA